MSDNFGIISEQINQIEVKIEDLFVGDKSSKRR